MACCGKGGNIPDIYLYIDDKEYHLGHGILSLYLRGLREFYEIGSHTLIIENRKTQSRQTGTLTYNKGFPYLNGRRLF
jgi:hypothetical protein